jgi:gephyrin
MSYTGVLRAKILVISTTASKDPSTDASGGILTNVFETDGAGKWNAEEVKIVGDDVLEIQRSITAWTDAENAANLIVTTGGTGFAVSDSAPEVRKHRLRLRSLTVY